ncbi:hypothetical protein [Methylotenera sp.]|uniref:hypothetical protein n=1 Tax=Methylotenera sp. TaxID=2051956 RepID=UPI002486FF84|nr:hypothetical protein [Methylotenera sp.]MDI1360799.1 hypothetical protein [Methylotenera sp.]
MKPRRTKEEMCVDVYNVLISELHCATKHAVFADVIWKWSLFDGKYKGCKYWSEDAFKVRKKKVKFIHEHVVPKKLIIERLMSHKNPSQESVKHILEDYFIAVVVTVDQDKKLNKLGLRSKMPEGCNISDNPWARYDEAGIKKIEPDWSVHS